MQKDHKTFQNRVHTGLKTEPRRGTPSTSGHGSMGYPKGLIIIYEEPIAEPQTYIPPAQKRSQGPLKKNRSAPHKQPLPIPPRDQSGVLGECMNTKDRILNQFGKG